MLIILFILNAAFAIKDGLDEVERRLLCGGELVQSVMTEGFARSVTVYRRGQSCYYQRTDRGYFSAHDLFPLRMFLGDDYVNTKRLEGMRVLDAGCGDGSFVRHLHGLGAVAHGVDIKLTEYQHHNPGLFTEADMLKTGLPAGSYDYIFSSFSTFYYEPMNFELLHGILAEFARLLKPGGILVLGGNPRRRLDDHDPLDVYLRDAYRGRNDYIDRLLEPARDFKLKEASGDRVVLIKRTRFFGR